MSVRVITKANDDDWFINPNFLFQIKKEINKLGWNPSEEEIDCVIKVLFNNDFVIVGDSGAAILKKQEG
jgi:hypothetical protein